MFISIYSCFLSYWVINTSVSVNAHELADTLMVQKMMCNFA